MMTGRDLAGRLFFSILLAAFVGCSSLNVRESGNTVKGVEDFEKLDGAKTLWELGSKSSVAGKDKDAFVLLRLLVYLYPDTSWASKARGMLADNRFATFEFEYPRALLPITQNVPKEADGAQGRSQWAGLHTKNDFRGRFGAPDEIQSATDQNGEEKWIYLKDKRMEVSFRNDRFRLIEVKDVNGQVIERSVSFWADPPSRAKEHSNSSQVIGK